MYYNCSDIWKYCNKSISRGSWRSSWAGWNLNGFSDLIILNQSVWRPFWVFHNTRVYLRSKLNILVLFHFLYFFFFYFTKKSNLKKVDTLLFVMVEWITLRLKEWKRFVFLKKKFRKQLVSYKNWIVLRRRCNPRVWPLSTRRWEKEAKRTPAARNELETTCRANKNGCWTRKGRELC